MSAPTHCENKDYRRMIDEVVIDELPTEKWEKLRQHLLACTQCRARYNKAVLAARMLHGGLNAVGTPSPGELDRIARAVLDGHAPDKSGVKRLLQWFAPVQRWGTGVALAAAAIVLIPLILKPQMKPVEEFQPRGGKKDGPIELYSKAPHLKPTERAAGLRAFCLVGDKVIALDPKGNTPPKCSAQSQLKLAVSNPGKYQKVFLVGVDSEYSIKWYAPRPPETESVAAPVGTGTVEAPAEIPVGVSVRLAVNHQPGPVRLFALFSDKSVTVAEVEKAVDSMAKQKVRLSDQFSLSIDRPDVLQRSVVIDVGP